MERDFLHRSLKVYCAQNGITLHDAAKQFGISYQYVRLMLTGRRPMSKKLLPKFAKVFGLDSNVLGLMRGVFPKAFIEAARKDPIKVMQFINGYLKAEGYSVEPLQNLQNTLLPPRKIHRKKSKEPFCIPRR